MVLILQKLRLGLRTVVNGKLVIPVYANSPSDCTNCALEKECYNLKFACYIGSEPIKFLGVYDEI
mgnify:CR=1 FL=1